MRVSIIVFSALVAVMAVPITGAQADWRSGLFGIPQDKFTARPAKKAVAQRRKTASPRKKTSSTKKKRVTAAKRRSTGSSRRGGSLRGMASFYWQPQRVASGGWFNPNALTAAHKTLRFGTRVRVTNLRNGRSVVVRINDRGPYIRGRIIDLSRRAAGIVGMRKSGVAPVRVDIL